MPEGDATKIEIPADGACGVHAQILALMLALKSGALGADNHLCKTINDKYTALAGEDGTSFDDAISETIRLFKEFQNKTKEEASDAEIYKSEVYFNIFKAFKESMVELLKSNSDKDKSPSADRYNNINAEKKDSEPGYSYYGNSEQEIDAIDTFYFKTFLSGTNKTDPSDVINSLFNLSHKDGHWDLSVTDDLHRLFIHDKSVKVDSASLEVKPVDSVGGLYEASIDRGDAKFVQTRSVIRITGVKSSPAASPFPAPVGSAITLHGKSENRKNQTISSNGNEIELKAGDVLSATENAKESDEIELKAGDVLNAENANRSDNSNQTLWVALKKYLNGINKESISDLHCDDSLFLATYKLDGIEQTAQVMSSKSISIKPLSDNNSGLNAAYKALNDAGHSSITMTVKYSLTEDKVEDFVKLLKDFDSKTEPSVNFNLDSVKIEDKDASKLKETLKEKGLSESLINKIPWLEQSKRKRSRP